MPMENNRWKQMISADWPQRLTALLVGFFLLQYVEWITKEKVIWLIETVWLVKWTLLIVGMTYLIPRIHWLLRSILQLFLIVIVQMGLFGFHFVSIHLRPYASLRQSLFDNFSQLQPFIWFSLTAWLVYAASMWLVKVKLRIYVMILISVLFFAVRDSFATIVLWQQVSMILFCGLSLLIVRHFSELKNRAPKSWEMLTEYPATLGIPIILLVAATVLIGALIPSINPVLTDPYTAWKVSRGETLAISGKGLPVSIPSKDASSGYSRDDRQLGGGFKFDYSIVMSVNTDSRTYMRGETRSFYNGSGWEPSDTEKRLPLSGVGSTNLPQDSRFNLSELKTKEVKQTVMISSNENYPILFGGFAIQKLVEVNKGDSGFEALRWSPRQSELRFIAKNNYPKQYTIVSQEPEFTEDELRSTTANYAGKPEWNEYVQLPKDLPARVKQLALNLTQDADNPYDKAKKLEQYLSQTFPYTNTPDLSKGSSKDFVDRFLFEIKEGYCDYYSTAMVVMSRAIGLPARWVKGYSSGQSPIPPELESLGMQQSQIQIDPDGEGIYTIRNSDAHSWVEVYFDGWGWIPFEPTAGFTMPTVIPSAEATAPTPLPDSDPAANSQADQASDGSPFVQLLLISFSIIIILLLGLYLLLKFGWLTEWKEWFKRKKVTNFNQKIIIEFERLLRYGSRKGYSRKEHETMREAVDRWGKQSRWMKSDLETLLHLFEKAKYSQAAASEQDFVKVNQSIEKLRIQMK